MQDLADVIMMLSMRPAEVTTLRIIHYEESDYLKWYKPGYSWYCTGYAKNKQEMKINPVPRQFLSMEKNPEQRARELLIWIQDAIATRKISDPVYGDNGKRNTRAFSKFLKPYGITAKRLRKIGGKHASRVHGGQNPTTQRLDLLCRIALRHKIDRFDSGKYYAEGDTSDSEPESQISTPQSKNNDLSKKAHSVHYNPFDSQIAEIDSMLTGMLDYQRSISFSRSKLKEFDSEVSVTFWQLTASSVLPKNNDLSNKVHYDPFEVQLAEIDSMLAEMRS
ncbi:13409_t:CDS:2 [Entrophospora sp. SA101]|nr:13409_t:CDS:2 [Entrophospora sp. SA101]